MKVRLPNFFCTTKREANIVAVLFAFAGDIAFFHNKYFYVTDTESTVTPKNSQPSSVLNDWYNRVDGYRANFTCSSGTSTLNRVS